jgi:hypothetical protein
MIHWLKTLFRIVRVFGDLPDEALPIRRAIIVWPDGRISETRVKEFPSSFRVPEVVARFVRADDPPTLPKMIACRCIYIHDGVAVYRGEAA